MRAVWLTLAFAGISSGAVAQDAGPLRDLNWGATPADNGIAYTGFDVASSHRDVPNAGVLLPDGRLLSAGTVQNGASTNDFGFVQIMPTHGTPDNSFGTGGKETLGLTVSGDITDLLRMPDGRILYAGNTSSTTLVVGRMLANGLPDNSFDFDGRRLLSGTAFLSLAQSVGAPKLLLLPDGKIILTASTQRSTPTVAACAAAMRLNADGSTDNSFGGQGTGTVCYGPDNDGSPLGLGNAVARTASGKLLMAGTGLHLGGSGTDMTVLRMSADGALDTTFGTNGYAFVPFDLGGSLGDFANMIALDATGRILIAGSVDVDGGQPTTGIARLTSEGQLDASFGTAGRLHLVIHHPTPPDAEYAMSLVPLRDGRILVGSAVTVCGCGGQASAGVITMLRSDGSVNPFFGVNGSYQFGDATTPDAQILDLQQMFTSGDYAYVVGWAHSPSGALDNPDFASARVIVPLFKSGFEAAIPDTP